MVWLVVSAYVVVIGVLFAIGAGWFLVGLTLAVCVFLWLSTKLQPREDSSDHASDELGRSR